MPENKILKCVKRKKIKMCSDVEWKGAAQFVCPIPKSDQSLSKPHSKHKRSEMKDNCLKVKK